jgi:hypothetical protein
MSTTTDLDKTDLLSALEDLGRYAQSREDDGIALVNTREVRAKLEGLVGEMDDLESGFDRSVELSRM